ncbi:LysR family transcriptional regulator [Pseudooceanicola nanhaiensis]|jgi:LysR family glycine cleavage system transcriptional activator|uniref:LysR family transcriptional regulator n=1 Tax=Pseudooceanicola nanhaiensis TaxID=375761 RepID=A0A917T132_9RHOB|nr:LysR family transcriptional regulator [Pseudooceanicola nanhaiensis]GGM05466.1 LysR family transcriptional regulator [Pseudooceanicola nanhaiensis]
MPESFIPTIRELEAFCELARAGTTHLAARRVHLSQTAVSRSVRALEDRLGVALFVRQRQRMTLSDAGRAFLPKARRLLDDLNAAAVGVMAFGGQSTVLRIAVLPSFGRSWLIPRLGGFLAAAPGTTVDVAARLDPVDFAEEPFDLAIQRSRHRSGAAHHLHLLDESLVAVCSPALTGGLALSDEDLLALPLLQQTTRPTLWLDWFRHANLDSRRILRGARFDHFDMVIDAAIAGLGAGLVPEVLARGPLREGRLIRASAREMDSGQAYTLIYPDRAEEMPQFTRFRAWIRAELEGIWG